MKLIKKAKLYLTTGIIAPMFTQCTLEDAKPKFEKPKPNTESLAYLAYKNRLESPNTDSKSAVFFGDEWAI